jgi:hypothetical protein
MPPTNPDTRFLLYQIKAIRRFQRLREPRTGEEAQRLALEWISRFADAARRRWIDHARTRGASAVLDRSPWKA